MSWELIGKTRLSEGSMYNAKRRSVEILEYGYLTYKYGLKCGMKINWYIDVDGLEIFEIIAVNNMDKEEVNMAIREFRSIHPEQKLEVSQKLLEERQYQERKRQEWIREDQEKQARRAKFRAEERAKEEEEQRRLKSRKEKYCDIK